MSLSRVLPAVVGDHRPGRVERLGQVVERRREVAAAAGVVRDRRHAPALVERHPGDDAGVAAVAAHHLDPLARRAARPPRGENAYALAISPQTSRPSRSHQYRKRGSSIFWCMRTPLKPNDLISSTSRRSASALGRREVRLRPVALLEDEPQVVRPAVEQEPAVAARRTLRQAEVAGAPASTRRRRRGVDQRDLASTRVGCSGVQSRPPRSCPFRAAGTVDGRRRRRCRRRGTVGSASIVAGLSVSGTVTGRARRRDSRSAPPRTLPAGRSGVQCSSATCRSPVPAPATPAARSRWCGGTR